MRYWEAPFFLTPLSRNVVGDNGYQIFVLCFGYIVLFDWKAGIDNISHTYRAIHIDIPLDTESTLAKSLSPWEGIPPLYATTRVVLEQIFASMENGSKPNVHHTASTAMNKVKWGLRVMNAITHHPKSN